MYFLSQVITLIKFFGSCFFIWAMPLAVMVLNILKQRELFETNVVIAILLGITINVSWDLMNKFLEKKEYHKNLL